MNHLHKYRSVEVIISNTVSSFNKKTSLALAGKRGSFYVKERLKVYQSIERATKSAPKSAIGVNPL
jgi:hypothetical protein